MTTVGREEVQQFIASLIQILSAGGRFYLIPRAKNRDALLRMGLTFKNCKQEVMKLKVQDYCSGPDSDLDPKFKGFVWTFGKEICGQPVYIKMKIVMSGAHQAVICISFYEAEYPLKNVYR